MTPIGITLRPTGIGMFDALHLINYLKQHNFFPIDINHERIGNVRLAIADAKSQGKHPLLVDVIRQYPPDKHGNFVFDGDVYPVLEVTSIDEVYTYSLIQELMGMIATG